MYLKRFTVISKQIQMFKKHYRGKKTKFVIEFTSLFLILKGLVRAM